MNRKKERNYYGRFPGGSAGKESTCNAGDLGFIPGWGRFPREGKGYPFQYSGLENSMDCIVHGVANSRTRLSDFHFHFLTLTQCNRGQTALVIRWNLSFFLIFRKGIMVSVLQNYFNLNLIRKLIRFN